jgi:predicted DNA-binding transcriptional regulator AlpA
MRADNAAAYVGMSQASFFRLVEDGLLPKPIRVRGMVLWDRHDLDGWFDDLKHEEQPRNTMHDILGIADGS